MASPGQSERERYLCISDSGRIRCDWVYTCEWSGLHCCVVRQCGGFLDC